MVALIKNFDKDDCVHYKIKLLKPCCGRARKPAGFCTIEDYDGHNRNKICSTKMNYCKYQPKEDEDVHIKKL